VVGDWTGSGTTKVGIVDPATATWYLRGSNAAGPADAGTFAYGAPGWKPLGGVWASAGSKMASHAEQIEPSVAEQGWSASVAAALARLSGGRLCAEGERAGVAIAEMTAAGG
jgi:hypothetical protein